jgi:hypothetical protein
MAQQNETSQAKSGNKQNETCPAWGNIGKEQLPFFNPTEKKKREGLRVKFMADGPRKQTMNEYDPNHPKPELWFDIDCKGSFMTWTIYQVSLLLELKKYSPLKGKTFDIKLIPVTKEFKDANPKYKGKDRYSVTEVTPDTEPNGTDNDSSEDVEEATT